MYILLQQQHTNWGFRKFLYYFFFNSGETEQQKLKELKLNHWKIVLYYFFYIEKKKRRSADERNEKTAADTKKWISYKMRASGAQKIWEKIK